MSQLLAGHNAGFRVRAQNEIIEDQFTKLSDAAKEGDNYWAVQAINTLRSLTSGYNGDNVYVSVDNQYADGRTLFKIVMPGCEAYVRHESNGELLILKIQASHDYAQMQEKGNKPGYFELETGLRGTALQVTPKTKVSRDHKTVVVCGGQPTLNDARKAAILYTKAMKIADPDDIGFVHTPRDSNTFRGNRRINSRRADQDPSLLESAHIVRDLMASAQGIGKVKWMTQGAGSGIMFQALKMRDKLPLDMNGHWLYLAGATTDTAKLEELAILRGFSTDRHNKYYDSLNPDQLIGSGRLKGGDILTAWRRLRSGRDPEYTPLKLGVDTASEIALMKPASNQVSALPDVIKKALVIGGVGGTLFGGVSAIAGLSVALATLGGMAFQSFFPEEYHDFKDKF